MSSLNYEGLFYLMLGFSVFLLLALSLRLLADKLSEQGSKGEASDSDHQWLGKERLEIIGIKEESHDIKTFSLMREDERLFPRFKAGQFLSFEINGDAKVLRSYSLSSSITNQSVLQVSIKCLNGGVGSSWFHHLTRGEKVVAYPPSGLFIDPEDQMIKRIYIAGGIGITPVLSMIRSNLELSKSCEMVLFYGMKTEQDMAFHDYLLFLSKHFKTFSYHPILSQPTGAWSGDVGHITADFIDSKGALDITAAYLMCGPEAMTTQLINGLKNRGVAQDQVHYEKFASPSSFDPESLPERELSMTYNGINLQYKGRMTVLESLESHGQSHPFACRVGVCGACKCKLSGQCKVVTDAGLSEEEKGEGLVLACVSYPEGDVKINSL